MPALVLKTLLEECRKNAEIRSPKHAPSRARRTTHNYTTCLAAPFSEFARRRRGGRGCAPPRPGSRRSARRPMPVERRCRQPSLLPAFLSPGWRAPRASRATELRIPRFRGVRRIVGVAPVGPGKLSRRLEPSRGRGSSVRVINRDWRPRCLASRPAIRRTPRRWMWRPPNRPAVCYCPRLARSRARTAQLSVAARRSADGSGGHRNRDLIAIGRAGGGRRRRSSVGSRLPAGRSGADEELTVAGGAALTWTAKPRRRRRRAG